VEIVSALDEDRHTDGGFKKADGSMHLKLYVSSVDETVFENVSNNQVIKCTYPR
jgi:hypothetical protein